MSSLKPMLSGTTDGKGLRYPLLASPKLDGIRCLIRNSTPVTRTLKFIPNLHVRRMLSHVRLNGLDGELVVGPTHAPDVYNRTNSGIMSRDGEPDFTYQVFDYYPMHGDRFSDRLGLAATIAKEHGGRIHVVKHQLIHNEDALFVFEESMVKKGYEGIMLRDPSGVYKFGRSTLREGLLLKLKRWEDSEAEILGISPLMRNTNEAKRNALGNLERSSAKSGKVADAQVGTVAVRDVKTGVEFDIGTGFTEEQRIEFWNNRKKLIGKLVKYKYQPAGVKDKPRFPVFLGFRDKRDM